MSKMNVLKVAEIGVTLMNITDLDKAKINDFYCKHVLILFWFNYK